MHKRLLAALTLTLCCPLAGLAAELTISVAPGEELRLERRDAAEGRMHIDGVLTEEVWQQLPAYDEFVVIEPDTLAEVPHATLVRLFYTGAGLYVGVDMQQPSDTLYMRLSGRDDRMLNRDSINLTLDTSGEGRYGYWFGVALGDSLMDGTVLPERQFSSDWDGAWRGATSETGEGWSAEFFIPWGTVAMPKVEGSRSIGLYMSRKVAYKDERWGWPALPDTTPKFLSVLQPLQLEGIDPKQQYSVYPFIASGRDRIDGETRHRVGADFFWRPSSNFQLTATVNPDFGIVESDDVVINLTATETFFPEKRLFFLEGQGVFNASPRADVRGGGVGNRGSPTTLVNTRRIGGKPRTPVAPDGVSIPKRETIQPVELLGAAKATGQIGRIRYGLMAAFEDDVNLDGRYADDVGLFGALAGQPIRIRQSGSDYGVVRVLYEDSRAGAYRAAGLLSTAALHPDRDAVAHSVDLHYLTASGKLKFDTQLFTSDIEDEKTGYGGFTDFEYTFRQGLVQRFGIAYFDEDVDINDLGYLGRNDALQLRTSHIRTSSNLGWAKFNQFDVRGMLQQNMDGLFTTGGIFFSNHTMFNNLSQMVVRLNFLPEYYDDLNSFGNGAYRIEERVSGGIHADTPSTGNYLVGGGMGFNEEHLGGMSITAEFHADWRPNDQVTLFLSTSYQNRDGWLLHQEDANLTTFTAEQWRSSVSLDYFISARQRLRGSLQWTGIRAREDEFYLIPARPGDLIETTKPAGPSDNFAYSQLSFQLRYRWEIAPLSDLFAVYTRAADGGRALGDASFSDLFSDSYDEPLGNLLVVKLRYRFGS